MRGMVGDAGKIYHLWPQMQGTLAAVLFLIPAAAVVLILITGPCWGRNCLPRLSAEGRHLEQPLGGVQAISSSFFIPISLSGCWANTLDPLLLQPGGKLSAVYPDGAGDQSGAEDRVQKVRADRFLHAVLHFRGGAGGNPEPGAQPGGGDLRRRIPAVLRLRLSPGYSGKCGDVPAPLRVVGHLAEPWLEYDHLSGGPFLCGFGLHEAAQLDGANRLKRVVYIDLPILLPTAAIMLILSVGSLMSVGFDKAYLMQNNANLSASEIISTYIYKTGMNNGTAQFSYATAIGLFNSAVNCCMLLVVNKLADKVGDGGYGLLGREWI